MSETPFFWKISTANYDFWVKKGDIFPFSEYVNQSGNNYEIKLGEVIKMITPELLARINELARKKRTVGLTEDELAEQKNLYEIYLSAIRGQVTNLLDSIEIVDEKPQPPPKKKKKFLKQATINLKQVFH